MSMWKRKSGAYEVGGGGEYEPSVAGRESGSYTASDGRASGSYVALPAPEDHSHDDAAIEAKLVERFGKTQSALGHGTVVQGKLSFETSVRMDGKLSGEIVSTRAVIVGRTGDIEAEVEVATLIVIGKVRGNVRATERVEILAGGEVQGSVTTPVLLVEEGSVLNGTCTMTPSKGARRGRDDGSSWKSASDVKVTEGESCDAPHVNGHA